MEFRLTYEGLLLGASRSNTRAQHKHEIRAVFHKQLKRLFETHPAFEFYRPTMPYLSSELAVNNQAYVSAGYKLFPLARRNLSLLCSINILFCDRICLEEQFNRAISTIE
jgi:hypothetical protein